jgi:hypothetical protein
VGEWGARVVGKREPSGLEVVLDSAVVEEGDYTGLKLSRFVSIGSRFSACRFESMKISMFSAGAGTEPSEYVGCFFDGTRMEMHPGGFASFIDCSFRDVVITHWSVKAGDMLNCTFSGKIKTAIFNGTVDPHVQESYGKFRNEFEGNDFSNAEMVDVAFRTGIDLRRQILPAGPDYCYVENGAAALEVAFTVVDGWGDDEVQRGVRALLDRQQDLVRRGQEQLFLQRSTGRNARFWPQVCAALRGEG